MKLALSFALGVSTLAFAVACTQAAEMKSTGLQEVTSFAAKENQLPEGLAIHKDRAYLGMATSQTVYSVNLHGRDQKAYAQFPQTASGKGFLTGLTFDKSGTLMAGLASFDATVKTGIYAAKSGASETELVATHDDMKFPNDFANHPDGGLLISDSISGIIWKLDSDGTLSKWISDPLLTGDPNVCAPDEVSFPIGVNGMDFGPDGNLYAAVTDRAAIMKIELNSDGTAGTLSQLGNTDCDLMEGADGIKALKDGIVVAVNRTNQITEVSYKGQTKSLSKATLLDFPASIAMDGNDLYISNFALMSAGSVKAKPGLLKFKK